MTTLRNRIKILKTAMNPTKTPSWIEEAEMVVWVDGYKTALDEVLKIIEQVDGDIITRRIRQMEQVDELINKAKTLDRDV